LFRTGWHNAPCCDWMQKVKLSDCGLQMGSGQAL